MKLSLKRPKIIDMAKHSAKTRTNKTQAIFIIFGVRLKNHFPNHLFIDNNWVKPSNEPPELGC